MRCSARYSAAADTELGRRRGPTTAGGRDAGDDEGDQRQDRAGVHRLAQSGRELPGHGVARRTPRRSPRGPSAPPICCVVWSRPDAVPACLGSTPDSTTTVSGMNSRPTPTPLNSRGPARSAQYVLVSVSSRSQTRLTRASAAPGRDERPGAEPRDQPRRDAGDREDRQAQRQERDARLERAEAERALHELHQQEEQRELRADDQRHRDQRRDARTRAQQRGLEQGLPRPALDAGERSEQDRRGDERRDRAGSRTSCGPLR